MPARCLLARPYTPGVDSTAVTTGAASPASRPSLLSWALLTTVATLGGLSALFVALVPAADQTPLNGRTWQQLAAADPEVASIVARLLVVLGLLGVGLGATAALVTLFAYRRGARWAWYALWLVPLIYGAIAVRQLADAYAVGWFYAGLAAFAVVGLVVSVRRFTSR